ncbi:MAG: RHS repeat-associated core domain-containing protein, partial [Chloroflexota bacterium]|nr:RHS repeat-associated core domain-containing protein [Chloroflexota bacterium]
MHAPNGQTLAEQRGGVWTYPLVDSLRNVRQWSSADGEILGGVEYRSFGTPEETVGTIASPYGYTGEYHQAETSLVYLRARHYAPRLGRFTQRDPWTGDYQRPQTLNLYSYVENNAVNFTDRTGLCTSCRRGSTVEVRNANQYGGLAVRTEPNQDSRLLMRLPDSSRVVIAEDIPVQGPAYQWHSTYLSRFTGMIAINYGRVWLANDWLYDIEPPGPPRPPSPGPSPSPTSNWVLPLDEPIKYWNGYGYYNWSARTDGICHPCASYQQPELEHSDYTCNLCLHKGWDLTSLSSTNVYAMGDGTVLWRNDHILAISHVVNE